MKAIIHPKYGPPEVLEIKTIDQPIPKDNEVLIKVHAATVNRTDCANLRAKPFIMRFVVGFFKPRNRSLGTDFAGEIMAIGKDVKDFKVGDRVFGFDDVGLSSHAEFMTITSDKAILTIPENTSYEEAAACAEGFHYAYTGIKNVQIKKGQKILVNGASGAIGSAVLQLSKYLGAEVTAVTNTKNLNLIKSLGASRVIDYLKEDFTKEDAQYDYIFDAVGKSSFNKCKPLLKEGGIYNSSELGWMAQNIFYALFTPLFYKKKVIFPIPSDIKASLEFVKKMIEEGQYKAVIDRTYSMGEIVEAFHYVETGEKTGNVILKMQ